MTRRFAALARLIGILKLARYTTYPERLMPSVLFDKGGQLGDLGPGLDETVGQRRQPRSRGR